MYICVKHVLTHMEGDQHWMRGQHDIWWHLRWNLERWASRLGSQTLPYVWYIWRSVGSHLEITQSLNIFAQQGEGAGLVRRTKKKGSGWNAPILGQGCMVTACY